MIILGIDPGLAIVGWGVIEAHRGQFRPIACGDINTPAHTSVESRLKIIYDELNRIIGKYKPEEVAIEELFFTNNITTGITVAEARGVILLACQTNGLPIHEYTPPQVKQAVVGYGRAEKKQVIDMVRRILNMPSPPKPDDAADAVAMAICHARSSTSLLTKNGGHDVCSTI